MRVMRTTSVSGSGSFSGGSAVSAFVTTASVVPSGDQAK